MNPHNALFSAMSSGNNDQSTLELLKQYKVESMTSSKNEPREMPLTELKEEIVKMMEPPHNYLFTMDKQSARTTLWEIVENKIKSVVEGILPKHIISGNGYVIYEKNDKLHFLSKKEGVKEVEYKSFKEFIIGDESIYVAECNDKLGDTGATVTNAEISPISIKAILEMPRQEITEIGFHESQEEINGELVNKSEPFEFVTYEEPPRLSGVKLVDGTILPNMYMGPGTMGYVDDVSDTYEVRFAIDRILDVNQVESLLFVKSYPGGEEEYTEDNFYVVDIR